MAEDYADFNAIVYIRDIYDAIIKLIYTMILYLLEEVDRCDLGV